MKGTSTEPSESHVPTVRIGDREFASRFFLAPLAGYTQLPFRRVMRRLGGLGLATTDLVQATHLLSGSRKSMQLVETSEDDKPLSVQIFSGHATELMKAACWLEDHGFEGVDINMGCPMAKVNGQGGGARLMCDMTAASSLVGQVVKAVSIPVTVKMRLGWDHANISSPLLARCFEQEGCAAITIHGRTRAQGFHGSVDLDGIAATVDAVDSIPVVGNGDVRSPEEAFRMLSYTGCEAVAIGRGAMLDPWIFQQLRALEAGHEWSPPSPVVQVAFLKDHFEAMFDQHGDYACILFRKFAAWYGARLGIPERLEDRLRRIETPSQFNTLLDDIINCHGERQSACATALVKVPNGPISHW